MPDRDQNRPLRTARRDTLGKPILLTEIQHPLLRKVLALWTDLKGARRFPTRDELSPRVMAGFLRNIVFVRVIEGGEEYQFRVVGDAIVEVQGESFQGLNLAEIDAKRPGYGTLLRPIYDWVRVGGEPLAYRGLVERVADHRSFLNEALLLPLGADEQAVDHILVVAAYQYTADKDAS